MYLLHIVCSDVKEKYQKHSPLARRLRLHRRDNIHPDSNGRLHLMGVKEEGKGTNKHLLGTCYRPDTLSALSHLKVLTIS
jgi:hypothetical protein